MYFKLPKMFYLSQLFINSMFAFLLQELQYIYVTGFERTHLPRTQQEDTLFTITR